MHRRSRHRNGEGPLVTTSWLARHLDDRAVHVIEVDRDPAVYERSHIPGALAWDLNDDLNAEGRRDYINQAQLSRLLRRTGVPRDGTLVLYGGADNGFAASAYWLLKLRGFENAKLLDGGRRAWEREGRPVTRRQPPVAVTDITVRGLVTNRIRAFRDEVVAAASADSFGDTGDELAFVDVRSPEEFSGDRTAAGRRGELSPVPGHIPGAANVPWNRTTNEDGTYLEPRELRRLYAASGITPDRDVVAYCSVGERSPHTWFALHELLGYPNVKNYDGAWTEYGSLVGVPVEIEQARATGGG